VSGRYAVDAEAGTARPDTVRTWCSVAQPDTSRARRDLPIPASPASHTQVPSPRAAAVRPLRSVSSSGSRPTITGQSCSATLPFCRVRPLATRGGHGAATVTGGFAFRRCWD
jgi:hypothetical protein